MAELSATAEAKETEDLFTDNQTVERFREYLRFNTTKDQTCRLCGPYVNCVEFLRNTCKQFGFNPETLEPEPGNVILFVEIPGTVPLRSGVLLTSHYDVVPGTYSF